jgi:hypothetical protein
VFGLEIDRLHEPGHVGAGDLNDQVVHIVAAAGTGRLLARRSSGRCLLTSDLLATSSSV